MLILTPLLLLMPAAGLLAPGQYYVERKVQIEASPEVVHRYVATLRRWQEWTVWNRETHPHLRFEYSGPHAGVGAVQTWTDPEGHMGRVQIISSDPEVGVEYILEAPQSRTPVLGSIKYRSDSPHRTEVTWSTRGELGRNPLYRLMGLTFDYTAGRNYEEGLTRLKRVVENLPNSSISQVRSPRSQLEQSGVSTSLGIFCSD